MKTRKPVDQEHYRGYTILLWSHDWDAQFEVRLDGFTVHRAPDRDSAKKWIDARLKAR